MTDETELDDSLSLSGQLNLGQKGKVKGIRAFYNVKILHLYSALILIKLVISLKRYADHNY